MNAEAQNQNENGWNLYNAYNEFRRMGIEFDYFDKEKTRTKWRFSLVNQNFEVCPTYPDVLVVPANISDTTLIHASKYRSKKRLPVLSYLYKPNNVSISRSSQPLVGLKQARSVQDEKLVESIFEGCESSVTNVIVDARPTTNAVVNRAVGAGSENMNHYKKCRKAYLGIDNIHVMRSSANKLAEAIKDAFNGGSISSTKMHNAQSEWVGHLSDIIQGANEIVCSVLKGEHVLVHCSDGWDRTAQLTSLAQLCLDPYYRTIEGFLILIEKEWVRFGHQFSLRNGHIGIESRFTVSNSSQNITMKKTATPEVQQPKKGILGSLESPKSKNGRDLNSSRMNSTSTQVSSEAGQIDLGSTSVAFGRFATKTFKGMQSRLAAAFNTTAATLGDADVTNATFELENRQQSNKSMFGSKDNSETCMVFGQFLDCVYQIRKESPKEFEFNVEFLKELNIQTNSCRFGTFLGNNYREKIGLKLAENTPSLYNYLLRNKRKYVNVNYEKGNVIIPKTQGISLWSSYYLNYLIPPSTIKKGDIKAGEAKEKVFFEETAAKEANSTGFGEDFGSKVNIGYEGVAETEPNEKVENLLEAGNAMEDGLEKSVNSVERGDTLHRKFVESVSELQTKEKETGGSNIENGVIVSDRVLSGAVGELPNPWV
ncbi:hypothetical protein BB559_001886 [Furculomyces boomerangus]|uniref:Myotubularin phosphatase domain-containing protein n=1 Tax=Furculomyces boomerangus TaxID=61424 RepID=A0A2T9YZR9_9FUNG|nr:hypothetical protein BB559_001886 [Furculomyces boomerangus]